MSEVGTTPLISLYSFTFSDDICSRHFLNFVSGEKIIVFFLPANIHGVLIISGPTYHIYFPDFPLFPILIQYFHFIDTAPLFCNLCTSSLLFMVCFWQILHRSLVQFIRTTSKAELQGIQINILVIYFFSRSTATLLRFSDVIQLWLE